MQVILKLYCLLTVITPFVDARGKTVRVIKLEGTCPGYEDAAIQLADVHLSLKQRTNYISVNIVKKRDILNDFKVKLTLKRCPSREALDSCEDYQSITIKHFCKLINAENKPWSPFTKFANPPLGCPLKKGVHSIKNGTFDGSAFAHLPIAGWYWIVMPQIIAEDTGEMLMCMTLEGQIVPV